MTSVPRVTGVTCANGLKLDIYVSLCEETLSPPVNPLALGHPQTQTLQMGLQELTGQVSARFSPDTAPT